MGRFDATDYIDCLTERDIEKAQAMARRQGLPYATLLTSILQVK